ncbi:MAG TPA: hypothetical protein VN203_00425, partial [Candidatus Acidoferrum sp.]|nr:hypothetical protein [Candidatus Acidoferrum sp.]
EQDPGTLYRGTKLDQAVEWARENLNQLNAQEQAFLQASQAAAEREANEREAQRQRWKRRGSSPRPSANGPRSRGVQPSACAREPSTSAWL